MAKVLTLPKNFKRFRASNKFILRILQGFTFGVFNTRRKLKGRGYKFRTTDILPLLIVGEFQEAGCKVGDLSHILGYNNSLSQKILTRCTYRKLIWKTGGRKGRGHAAKYYLTGCGDMVYNALQSEMGKSFHEAARQLRYNLTKNLD